jgi:maltose-binding protein MalE
LINGVEKRNPGKRAILFYTEFSNPKKEIYTWNSDQENSIKLFANGKLAMMINYSYQMKNLLALNPYLNYGISKMPQLENSTPVNFSNVWTPVVSKNNNCKVEPVELSNKIDCSKIAWSFLSFASQKENARLYLDSTNKAAARKDLIAEQISLNNKTSVFASQADSAMSYNKFDDRIDGILTNMIDEINLDRENWGEKVDKATEEIERLR